MTSSDAVLRFAAEFATLLVAVAGVAVVVLRPRLLGIGAQSRIALALGFVALTAAAFLHGSLVLEADDPPLVLVRSLAVVLLAFGTLGWGEDRATRRVVWAALVLITLAEATALVGSAELANGTRAVGALGLGAVLVSSARRSIPARVATSTAATLLIVVLAVSVALSVVISDNIEGEALRRVEARAQAEAGAVIDTAIAAAKADATLIAASLQSSRVAALEAVAANPGADAQIEEDINTLARAELIDGRSPVLYITADRKLILQRNIDRAGAEVLAGSQAVTDASNGGIVSSVEVVSGGRALAVGVVPVGSQGRLLGFAIATSSLDDQYFGTRSGTDPNLGLAIVGRDGLLAGQGGHLPDRAVADVGREALGPAGEASRITAGAFLAAHKVEATGGVDLAVVAATPTSVVDDTRASLFRTLFLVALVTALAAFLAALLVGERIGVGLRRLAVAAAEIQRGDFGTRVDMNSQDELGVLGSTLNSMAGSIQTLTTELRQNRDEEAALRARLEAVVGGMGEAVVAVDTNGCITTFNGAAEELFSLGAEQVEGKPVVDVVHVAREDGTDLSPRLAHPDPGRWRDAAVVETADGIRVPVALSAGGLMGSEGRVGGGVYVLRDMRREREAERAKADLLANISHELRTPLVPIKGYSMMLRRGRLKAADARDGVQAISDAADQLERVVKRLLEVAEGGNGAAGRFTMVGPRDLVQSVATRWKRREGLRHRIERHTARNLPELLVDRERLEETLDELMENAAKFSPEGSRIRIGARLDQMVDGRRAVALYVSDEGRGMSENELSRIFDDFAQADTSATRAVGGLGLGLSVVRRTVELHGGELRCETKEGNGSCFFIALPVEQRSGAEA
ncbi:MAG TPA: ATP-binding protein [Acidimicrobiales bacterium]|nr:ATP-binding protein [Acidimicrobiales bacterium]